MKTFFIFLFIVFSISAFAQMPEPTLLSLQGYGGNQGEQVPAHVTKTQDGGFIICISSYSYPGTGNLDSFCMTREKNIFMKYNADASILEWSKCSTDGEYLFPLNNGNFIFGGLTLLSSGYAYKILEEDNTGSIIWYKTYGDSAGAELIDMVATDDGGFIMLGKTNYTDTDVLTHYGSWMDADLWVLKVDSNGNKVWSKVIGGSQDDEPFSVIAGPNGGCYVFGSTNSNDHDCTGLHGPAGGAADAYLARLDGNGNILWHRDLGGSGNDGYYGWGAADGKGGVLLATGSNSIDGDVHHNIGSYDYWVLDIDSNSNIVWENCYGSNGIEVPNAICKATDGSVWVTGASNQTSTEIATTYGKGDAWIMHADSAGNFLSGKVIGESQADEGEMICPLPGGLIFTGGYYSGMGGNVPSAYYGQTDVFLARIAPWTTGVKNITNSKTVVSVYPNPATRLIHIDVEPKDNFTLTVNNILGQQVYKTSGISGSTVIDVNEWEKGVYMMQVIGNNDYGAITKIIIE